MSTAPKAFASYADPEVKKITSEHLSTPGQDEQANIRVRRYGTRADVPCCQPVNELN